jgi:Two component regulator propeller
LSIPPYGLVVDQDKQLWTTDRVHIDILTPEGNWIKDIANNVIRPRSNAIRALVIDNQNRVWAGTENGLVECIGGKCTRYNPNLAYDLDSGRELTYNIRALAFDRRNRLWSVTGNGMYRLDVFLASLFERLVSFQWLENILFFVLAYLYGVRQLPRKNNSLIGGLGGGLTFIMLGVSFKLPIQSNIFFALLFSSTLPVGIMMIMIGLIFSVAVSMVAGFIGGKFGDQLVAYISGGAGVLALWTVLLLVFALAFAQ